MFGLSSAEQVHEFEKVVVETEWYKYFDSTNIGIGLDCATEAEPDRIYARLLNVPTD